LPVDKGAVLQKAEELIASEEYDMVVCVDRSIDECLKINAACRQTTKPTMFNMGAVHGWFGYSFSDFGDDFEFAMEVLKPLPGEKAGAPILETVSDDDEPENKRPRLHSRAGGDTKPKDSKDESKDAPKEKIIIRKQTSFNSLSDVFNNQSTGPGEGRRRSRIAPYPVGFYIFQIMAEFRFQHKRNPQLLSKSEDVRALLVERNAVLSQLGDIKIDIPENFASSLFEQMPAVCAIVGGVMVQEIIKAISKKDEPINNFFFYNPFDSTGDNAKIPRR